jgi:hypothetical protein
MNEVGIKVKSMNNKERHDLKTKNEELLKHE